MKKIVLTAFVILGMQAAFAQTQPAQRPASQKSKDQRSKAVDPNDHKQKKGSAGTYTTGEEIPDVNMAGDSTRVMDKNRKTAPALEHKSPQ